MDKTNTNLDNKVMSILKINKYLLCKILRQCF